MEAGDFVGAHKFVTKAQILFPNLDNIVQMIARCDNNKMKQNKLGLRREQWLSQGNNGGNNLHHESSMESSSSSSVGGTDSSTNFSGRSSMSSSSSSGFCS